MIINEKLLDRLSKLLIFQRLDSAQKLYFGFDLCHSQGDVLSDNVDWKYGGLINSGYNTSTPTTNTLKEWDIPDKNIFVSASYITDESTPDPTYSISLDDGLTWKDGIILNTVNNIKGLKQCSDGKYRLKLKFQMYQNPGANSWITRTNCLTSLTYSAYITLTSDLGISCGGCDSYSPLTYLTNTYKYTVSSNVWNTQYNDLMQRGEAFGISLTTNYGIIHGGHPTTTSNTDFTTCYIDSSNIVVEKAHGLIKAANTGGLSLTSDLGLIVGGNVSGGGITDTNRAYTFSRDSWAYRTAKITAIEGCGGISFTSDTGTCNGGNTGGLAISSIVQRYTYSSNSWSNKTSLPYSVDEAQELSLTTEIGMVTGGRVGTVEPYASTNQSTLYSLSLNTWTSMATISIARWEMGGFSLSKNNGFIYGGVYNSTAQDRSEKYTYGIPSFLGFSVLTW